MIDREVKSVVGYLKLEKVTLLSSPLAFRICSLRASIFLPKCRHREGVCLVKPQLITESTPTCTSHPRIPEQVSKSGRFPVVLIIMVEEDTSSGSPCFPLFS